MPAFVGPQNIDIGEGKIHIDSEDLPHLIQALSRILAFLASLALMGFGGWVLYLMRDTASATRAVVAVIGVVLAMTGAILLITSLVPNVPVIGAVFKGVVSVVKSILGPFLVTRDDTPIDPKKHAKRRKKVHPATKSVTTKVTVPAES